MLITSVRITKLVILGADITTLRNDYLGGYVMHYELRNEHYEVGSRNEARNELRNGGVCSLRLFPETSVQVAQSRWLRFF